MMIERAKRPVKRNAATSTGVVTAALSNLCLMKGRN